MYRNQALKDPTQFDSWQGFWDGAAHVVGGAIGVEPVLEGLNETDNYSGEVLRGTVKWQRISGGVSTACFTGAGLSGNLVLSDFEKRVLQRATLGIAIRATSLELSGETISKISNAAPVVRGEGIADNVARVVDATKPITIMTRNGPTTYKPIAPPRGLDRVALPASEVRFSQESVSYFKKDGWTYDKIVESMAKDGWRDEVGKVVGLVKMPDGKITSMDNTRVMAAGEANVKVEGLLRGYDDPLTPSEIKRFTKPRQPAPTTWGKAVEVRVKGQTKKFARKIPSGLLQSPKSRGGQMSGSDEPFRGRHLFGESSLPVGFQFPAAYLELMKTVTLPDLTPWWFLAENRELAEFWLSTVREQYPSRLLVPFAKREDQSDTLAAFDGADFSGRPKVFLIHAFTSPGWEERDDWDSFEVWLRQAAIESAEFKARDDE